MGCEGGRRMTSLRRLRFALVGLAAVPLLITGPAQAVDQPLPQAITHQHFNFIDPLEQSGDGVIPQSSGRHPASPICATTGTAPNVNTDCEGNAPHNETSIAANPTNSLNLVESANDYQLNTSSGVTIYETIHSRAHTSFDGGRPGRPTPSTLAAMWPR